MTEKLSFAIGIPTINRYDLLKPFLAEYLINFPLTDIFIMDNGKQGINIEFFREPNLHIFTPVTPKSVAASWNFLCHAIYKNHTHAFILNDDVFIGRTEHQIKQHLEIYQESDFIISQHEFCSFILPKTTFQSIGPFDEKFLGAYFEDKDYERRLLLAGKHTTRTAFINPSTYNKSSSIEKDPTLNKHFQSNWAYYREKWGGNIGGEIFTKPFNK